MVQYYRDPNFTGEDTEAERGEGTHLNFHRQKRALSEVETVHFLNCYPPGPSSVLRSSRWQAGLHGEIRGQPDRGDQPKSQSQPRFINSVPSPVGCP